LNHDGRGYDRVDAVVAVAAVADAVTVNLVDDVDIPVRVYKSGRIDGASLAIVVCR